MFLLKWHLFEEGSLSTPLKSASPPPHPHLGIPRPTYPALFLSFLKSTFYPLTLYILGIVFIIQRLSSDPLECRLRGDLGFINECIPSTQNNAWHTGGMSVGIC